MISYERIIDLAAGLKRRYPDCNPREIIDAEEIGLLELPMGTQSASIKGFLQKNNRCCTIAVNSDLPEALRSKILFHELGHYFLEHGKGSRVCRLRDASFAYRRDGTAVARMENEANFFAAECVLDDAQTLEVIHEYDIFTAAKLLRVPFEMLDYKLRLLHRTKRLDAYRDLMLTKSDFLMRLRAEGLTMD